MTDEKNTALKRLERLVGQWQIEITLPVEPPLVVHAQATFEWLNEGAFLVQRSSAERPEFPKGFSIIGCDGTLESYAVLYSDSRGVARIYHMSLSDREWKQWRNDPDFSQHFTGTFSADGKTITARWEKSSDGVHWEHDFDLVYVHLVPVLLGGGVRFFDQLGVAPVELERIRVIETPGVTHLAFWVMKSSREVVKESHLPSKEQKDERSDRR